MSFEVSEEMMDLSRFLYYSFNNFCTADVGLKGKGFKL